MPLYREYPPHPALAPYVQCFWSVASTSSPLINHVLPDGCVDLVFTMDANHCEAEAVGTMQTAASVDVHALTSTVGVRFKPGGALPFLRFAMHEITDAALPLDDVWGALGRRLAEQIHEAPTLAAKVTRLENQLLRARWNAHNPDTLMLAAVDNIQRANGHITVRALTAQLALSERQLERRFSQHTGLSPKMFARVVRFRSVAMQMREQPALSLQDLVHGSGFYDQAHFIHDFKAFSGLTPGEYLAQLQHVGFLQYSAYLL